MIVTIEGIHLRRSSGIDHQLIRVTVFVQPCRCDQKFCPVLPLSRKTVCRFAGKCKIFFGFVWHLKPPFGFRVQKERAAVSSLPAEVWNDLHKDLTWRQGKSGNESIRLDKR